MHPARTGTRSRGDVYVMQRLFRTPGVITPELLRLTDRVVPGAVPLFVPVRLTSDGLINECFENARRQVARLKGSVQHGWALWEWSGKMIEAEFHAVWRQPGGSLIDVSPRSDGETQILFIPDPSRVFEGKQINNVRVALGDDPRIHEYIALADRHFDILNRGGRASALGAVAVPRHEIEPVRRRMWELQTALEYGAAKRNDPCPCGSGRKFKECHGGGFNF